MEYLIGILLSIIGGLGFLVFRKSKQNTQLKADKDLTSQTEHSKIVDKEVKQSQEEIDKLESDKDKPVDDGFWDEYLQDKSRK